MAVIWREDFKIDNKVYPDRKVYKSTSLIITREEEKRAEKLDKALEEKIKDIKTLVEEKNLVKLKRKRGVLELWYLVGKNLQFIDDRNFLAPDDKQFIWEAIWYHIERIAPELIPGKQKKRRGTYRDHFLQCYKAGKFTWPVVKKGGTWSDWVEFFDSSINEDYRILEWVLHKTETEDVKDYWLKLFYRLLKQKFSGKITEVFTTKELYEELEGFWKEHKIKL